MSPEGAACELCGDPACCECSMCGRLTCKSHITGGGLCSVCAEAVCRLCGSSLSIGRCSACCRLVCTECSRQVDPVRRICVECLSGARRGGGAKCRVGGGRLLAALTAKIVSS